MSKSKKGNSLADLGGMVYSTNPEQASDTPSDDTETPAPSEQTLEAHLEKKGRGGKTAVLIKGFRGTEEDLKALAKDLKAHCATGGSVKDGEIIIQGKQRDKAMAYLRNKGFTVKRVGA